MAAAFLVLSAFLLAKYRSLSGEASVSGDIGRNLLGALDARLKKQDERILDLMARVDVLQSKGLQVQSALESLSPEPFETIGSKAGAFSEPPSTPQGRLGGSRSLEPTEKIVLQLLSARPRTSVEIKALVNKSREHTARLMKSLFERRLVIRNDSKKPFVYQITEQGRRYFSET